MVTLSLFRHAKSEWDTSAASDFERPLAPRGEQAAPLMGRYISTEGLVPDIVLCSPAVRARQTLDLARTGWTDTPEFRFEDKLYHASPERIISLLSALPGTVIHAMVVGHNPGMYTLANSLAKQGDASGLTQIGEKFPTAALAIIDMVCEWRDIANQRGELRAFVTPRSLS